jgi:hypothetical protein
MAAKNSTIDLSDLLANLRDRGHGNCPHDDRADGPEEDCRACLSDCAVRTIESIADANAALQGVAQQATALYKNAPPDWPMSSEQLIRARLLLDTCDQQSGDWTGAAFTLIREIVARMNGLQDVDSPEARLVRYQNALESIVGSIFTETDPKRAFVSLWGIAHDALSAPPTAAEVEAQPGSEVLCPRCAHVFCPSDDPLHFHHDGCPSCTAEEDTAVVAPHVQACPLCGKPVEEGHYDHCVGDPIGTLAYEDGSRLSREGYPVVPCAFCQSNHRAFDPCPERPKEPRS